MATLKISDLSVGDWVKMDGKHYQIYHLTLAGDAYGYRNVNMNCEEYLDGSIADVCPIPITAEILEKNGLEYIDDGNDAVVFLCCDMFWARLCVGDTFWQVGIHSEDKLDAVVCNIKHVHQLQHALRLAGIDKEINL